MNVYDNIKLCCGPLCTECELKLDKMKSALEAAWDEIDAWRKADGHCDMVGYCKGEYESKLEPEGLGLGYAIQERRKETDHTRRALEKQDG